MSKRIFDRRNFLKTAATSSLSLAVGSSCKRFGQAPYVKNNKLANKVFVLGLDGMDPALLRRFVARGQMPTFEKLMRTQHFGLLETTMPPQSPVAWASFITGTNPGGHGIYDFIHRDPGTFTPYMSTSKTYGAQRTLDVGNWSIPIQSERVELMRKGKAFWSVLRDNHIFSTIYKVPSNFPIDPTSSQGFSGMGTPDLLGSYGTFTYVTDADVPNAAHFTGGRLATVKAVNHSFATKLEGPPNSLRKDQRPTAVDLKIVRDPQAQLAKISVDKHHVVLKKGEWSEWLPLSFDLIPSFSGVSGMVQLYLQEVHPNLRLYVSPINIDPSDPAMPIATPESYSRELSEAVGRFSTLGFPQDTKALSHGVFNSEEFMDQADQVLAERLRVFDHELSRFNEGLFFFYVSTLDQTQHMMLRTMDPSHPLYEPNASERVKNSIYAVYQRMDEVVRQTLAKMDDRSTLIILSDHGFAPFTREFNVSTWLLENGFTVIDDSVPREEGGFFSHVDWEQTRAYAIGLNGIYINLKGREQFGSVEASEVESIKREIMAKIPEVRDPRNGAAVITRAYDGQAIYSGPYVNSAPDIVLGYRGGYRISDGSALGEFPKEIVSDRTDKWSADHCMDPAVVPGILLATKPVAAARPGIWDIGPTILKEFGLDAPAEMTGKPIFKAS